MVNTRRSPEAEERINKGGFTLFPLLSTSCHHSFTHNTHRGVVFVADTEAEDLAGAEARATVALKTSNKHKTNDIPQFSPPPPPPPPQSWTASFNPFRASLSTQQTTCSIREHLPTREAKDSEHPDSTGGGKDSVCTVKQGIYIYPRKHKRPPSGRQAKVVCKTMGTTGRSPISSRHPQTGLSPTIQGSSQAVQNTLHSQRIQRNRQRQCLVEFYTRPPGQKRHRGSKQTRQSRILQSTVLSSQTREQMETRDRPQLPKPISNGLKIQDGNPRINPHIAHTRGMGHIDRSLTHTFTFPFTHNQESSSGSTTRKPCISSPACPLVWPRPLWSSPR